MGQDLEEHQKKHPVPALLENLGIQKVTPKDKFTISYQEGLLKVVVKRSTGKTETATKYIKGGFHQMSHFDPNEMSKHDRNELINRKYKSGESQASLAQTFGLSQAMISRIAPVSREMILSFIAEKALGLPKSY